MNNQNLELTKKLFTAIYNGDVKTMTEIYHPEVEFFNTVLLDVQKGIEGIYLHLLYFELGKRVDGIAPEPSFTIVNENIVSVRFKMYIYKKNGKHSYHTMSLQFYFKENRIYKEESINSDWVWWYLAHGFKGFLIGWTKAANRKRARRIAALLKEFKAGQPIYKIEPLKPILTNLV